MGDFIFSLAREDFYFEPYFMVFDKSKKMKWLKVEKSLKEFCFYSHFYKMDESTATEKVQKNTKNTTHIYERKI